MYDVLCYGALCADHRIFLPHYPQPGEGLRIRRAGWTAGGNALIEARRLAGWGDRVVLMGDRLGSDAEGDLLARAIAATTIDGSYLVRDPDASTPRCHILITPDAERTILASRDDAVPEILPPAPLLAACRAVSVTRYGPHTAVVARAARSAGRLTIVGDATRPDDDWTPYADVIVTSASLLAAHSTGHDRGAQMEALHRVRGAAVLVTDGPRPVQALWREDGVMRSLELAPPRVRPADLIGAGDVFRAGVVHGLLRGWPWPRLLEFACAEAAAHVRGGA